MRSSRKLTKQNLNYRHVQNLYTRHITRQKLVTWKWIKTIHHPRFTRSLFCLLSPLTPDSLWNFFWKLFCQHELLDSLNFDFRKHEREKKDIWRVRNSSRRHTYWGIWTFKRKRGGGVEVLKVFTLVRGWQLENQGLQV